MYQMCLERVRRVPGISFSLLLFFHQLVLREEAERRRVKPVAKKEWRGGGTFSSWPAPPWGHPSPLWRRDKGRGGEENESGDGRREKKGPGSGRKEGIRQINWGGMSAGYLFFFSRDLF